jgi:hypothetical protein
MVVDVVHAEGDFHSSRFLRAGERLVECRVDIEVRSRWKTHFNSGKEAIDLIVPTSRHNLVEKQT